MRPYLLAMLLVFVAVAAWWSTRPPVTLDDLGSADPERALQANRLVEENPTAEAVLIEGLSSPTPRVRALCARHLGRMRSNAAVPNLELALHDPQPLVRVQAAIALRILRCWTDLSMVTATAADVSQPPSVREALILALGRRHEYSSRALLLRTAASGDVLAVRVAAVDALGCVARGDDGALAAVTRLARDRSLLVGLRQHAVISIANMRHPQSLDVLEAIVDDLSLPTRVRAQGAFALGRLGDARAVPFLARQADDVWRPLVVRINAVASLAELGVAHPHPFVEQALGDASTYVREAAVRATVRCHDVDLVDALTDAASRERDACVREQMSRGACRLRGELEQEEQ